MFSLKFKFLHNIQFRTSEFGHTIMMPNIVLRYENLAELLPLFLHPHPFLKDKRILSFGAKNNFIDAYQNISLFLSN